MCAVQAVPLSGSHDSRPASIRVLQSQTTCLDVLPFHSNSRSILFSCIVDDISLFRSTHCGPD